MKAVKAAIWKNGKESNGKEFFRPEPLKDERWQGFVVVQFTTTSDEARPELPYKFMKGSVDGLFCCTIFSEKGA